MTACEERPDGGGGFDVVVGNPPFLNQLECATAAGRGQAALLDVLTGGASRGYADASAAFLLQATRLCRPHGRVSLVQPQSLLAAKDAGPVRSAVLDRGSLTALWVSNEHVFDGASVYTCAPTVHPSGPRRGPMAISSSAAFTEHGPITLDADELAAEATWGRLAAVASGVPDIRFDAGGSIADVAVATADFRDQYYGLAGFLVEDADLSPSERADDTGFPRIVTSGLIDLAECRWGAATTRILKRRWTAPRIDRRRMAQDGTLEPWIARRLTPKILLATQTKTLEVYADAAGRYVPSTPLITVAPHRPDRIWHVAAALASPVCTAIGLRDYWGAALSATALKLSARQALALPLPADRSAWDRAAAAFEAAQRAGRARERRAGLLSMAEASVDAYRVPGPARDTLLDWWRDRLWSGRELVDPSRDA